MHGRIVFIAMPMQNFNFGNNNTHKPPERLFRRIIERIKIEEGLAAIRKRLSFSSWGLVLGTILFASAVIWLGHELAESEFGPFLSLFFSDTKTVFFHWQDFAFPILEAVPAIHIVALLATLLLVLGSLKLIGKYLDKRLLLLKSIKK